MLEQVAQEHVGAFAETVDDVATLIRRKVDGNRTLAAIVDVELEVVPLEGTIDLGGSRGVAHRVTGQRLDFDYVGTKVGQDCCRTRCSHPTVDLDHSDVVEGQRCAHRGIIPESRSIHLLGPAGRQSDERAPHLQMGRAFDAAKRPEVKDRFDAGSSERGAARC